MAAPETQAKRRRGWLVAGTLVLLGAATAAAAVVLAPRLLEELGRKLETEASQALGQPLKVAAIRTHWRGLRAELALEGITLGQPAVLKATSAGLGIDLLASLQNRRLVLGRLSLKGFEGSLYQPAATTHAAAAKAAAKTTAPKWVLAGFEKLLGDPAQTAGTPTGELPAELPSWFPRSLDLSIEKFALALKPAQGAESRVELQKLEAGGGIEPLLARGTLGAALAVQGQGLTLTFPSLWMRPTELGTFELKLARVSGPAKGEWEVSKLSLTQPGIQLQGKATWNDADGALDASLDLKKTDLLKVRRLLPQKLLPDGLRKWLETAITRATVDTGTVRLLGHPERWKELDTLDSASELLEVKLDLSALRLSYLEGWPDLDATQAKLDWRGGKLKIGVAQATLGDFKASDVAALLAPLGGDAPKLKLEARVQTARDGLTKFLSEGPLKGPLQPMRERVSVESPIDARLKLALNIDSGELPELTLKPEPLALSVKLSEGSKAPLPLREVHGEVHVKPGAGGDLEVELREIAGKDEAGRAFEASAKINAAFLLHVQSTLAWTELPTWLKRLDVTVPESLDAWKELEGTLPLSLEVRQTSAPASVKSAAARALLTKTEVKLTSDLRGLSLDFPAPVKKDSQEALPLEAELTLESKGLEKASLKLGGEKTFKLHATYESPRSLDVLLKAQQPLALRPWLDWWRLLGRGRILTEPKAGAAKTSARPWQTSAELRAPELSMSPFKFENVVATFDSEGTGFKVKVDSKEAAGDLRFKDGPLNGQIETQWARLKMVEEVPDAPPAAEGAEAPEEPLPEAWELKTFPSVRFKCEKLEYNGRAFGRVQAELKQTGEKLAIEQLMIDAPSWAVKVKSGEAAYTPKLRTNLEGELTVDRWEQKGAPGGSFKNAVVQDGKLKFHIAWEGAPNQFRLARADGDLVGGFLRGRLDGVSTWSAALINAFNQKLDLAAFFDSSRRSLDFWYAAVRIRLVDGVWHQKFGKLHFGSVYVRVEGDADLRKKELDLVIRTRNEVQIEEPGEDAKPPTGFEDREDGEVGGTLPTCWTAQGPLKDPKVSLAGCPR